MDTPESVIKERKPALDYIFHPKSIAVAGVSAETKGTGIANSYITRFEAAGFTGNIYAINNSEIGQSMIINNIILSCTTCG